MHTVTAYWAYWYCPETWWHLWRTIIDSKYLLSNVYTSKNPVRVFCTRTEWDCPAFALKEFFLCPIWTLINIEHNLLIIIKQEWLTAAITCSSNEPSFPPSLIFPVANGPSQDDSIIRSDSGASLSLSRKFWRHAPKALIVVLGSFCSAWGSKGSRSRRQTWIFRIWRICPSSISAVMAALRVSARFWEGSVGRPKKTIVTTECDLIQHLPVQTAGPELPNGWPRVLVHTGTWNFLNDRP